MQRRRNKWQLGFAMIQLSIAAFFAFAYYHRYWKWRHELAEVETSFLTPDGGNVTSNGMIWIFPALLFAIFACLHIVRYFVPPGNGP